MFQSLQLSSVSKDTKNLTDLTIFVSMENSWQFYTKQVNKCQQYICLIWKIYYLNIHQLTSACFHGSCENQSINNSITMKIYQQYETNKVVSNFHIVYILYTYIVSQRRENSWLLSSCTLCLPELLSSHDFPLLYETMYIQCANFLFKNTKDINNCFEKYLLRKIEY